MNRKPILFWMKKDKKSEFKISYREQVIGWSKLAQLHLWYCPPCPPNRPVVVSSAPAHATHSERIQLEREKKTTKKEKKKKDEQKKGTNKQNKNVCTECVCVLRKKRETKEHRKPLKSATKAQPFGLSRLFYG